MRTLFALAFVAGLAACSKDKPATTPEPPAGGGGRIAGPGQVVGDAALYDKLKTSTIALPAGQAEMPCEGSEATLGAQVAAWEKEMAGPIAASCDGSHCRVEIATPIDPSCDTNPDQDGCDGSAYVLEFDLDGAGAIDAATLTCMAAG